MNAEHVDLVEELRLRQWARINYVPKRLRDAKWHPIVLDEMQRRENEIAEQRLNDSTAWENPTPVRRGAACVPLMPTQIFMVHPGHTSAEAPHFLREAPVRASEMYFG